MKNNFLNSLIKAFGILANDILPLFFWTFLIFGFDSPDIAILTILSAAVHEIGHIIGGACADSLCVRSHISGFRIKLGAFGYLRDIAVLLGGPIANLAVFLICLPLDGIFGGYISTVGYVNLMTAISNLLPIEGYDGYGVIRKFLERQESARGLSILGWVSFFFSAALTLLSLYLLLKYGEGYWIFGVFFISTVGKIRQLVKRDVLGD